jgi:hypothetical protein
MAKASDIITDAMQDIGVLYAGKVPTTDEYSTCLRRLNNLLELWSIDSLLVPFRTQISHTLDGSESYTIGSGGDIDTVRPAFIESAYTVHQTRDYPLHVSRDRSEYDRIYDKSIRGVPKVLYYEPELPLGRIFIWYVGDGTYTLKMSVRGTLTSFPDITTEVDLAPAYSIGLEYNLAIMIPPVFEASASAEVIKLAQDSLTKIGRLNRQSPKMQYPRGIPGGRGRYNIEAGY